ncbi:hypothetical protein BDR26DRAFT_1007267 [Obelidium mucronatum]|nr:hypothetical protein BDR26DRAFT_1007267 [Obelidium mucronatum]
MISTSLKAMIFYLVLSSTLVAAGIVPAKPVQAFPRGLYISPYQSNSDLNYNYILTNTTSRSDLLDYINQKQITSISLYNLNKILPDPFLSGKLLDFIKTARSRGVIEVNAVGGIYEDFQLIHAFNQNNSKPFTGALTEIDFWNARPNNLILGEETEQNAFAAYISLLCKLKSFGTGLKLTGYVGWLDGNNANRTTARKMAAALPYFLDRVYVHAYVKDPLTAFDYVKERLALFNSVGLPLEVQPIFSAEGKEYNGGEGGFMGDWLRSNGMNAAESAFLADYSKDLTLAGKSQLQLTGFQYFEYKHLSYHVPLFKAPVGNAPSSPVDVKPTFTAPPSAIITVAYQPTFTGAGM